MPGLTGIHQLSPWLDLLRNGHGGTLLRHPGSQISFSSLQFGFRELNRLVEFSISNA
jgi:hypothetical protein